MSQLALRLDESTVEMLDLPIRSRMDKSIYVETERHVRIFTENKDEENKHLRDPGLYDLGWSLKKVVLSFSDYPIS
ncbi:hypothetical protein VTP01DRAFT_1961 [Rhizomucor pusillus]|uniref:uncharacterized protein n=1 Tax=Rhizomucor pusillus TaxID=4840 RepID=UPI003742C5B5